MGRATGQSDDSMQALIGTFNKVAAGGDISAASLTKSTSNCLVLVLL
ncbi:hypothetical protein GJ636_09655 [Leuconostoc citreum]|nr:hypothetical protein GJ636_09655 [Leuconostoc citreum]